MEDLRWGYGDSDNIVEPPTAKKSNGWNADEKPAAQYLNWWMNSSGLWMNSADARLTTNETDISAADTRITTNETDISTADGRITTNETDISTADGRITTNETDISTADGRITTNETWISNVGELIGITPGHLNGLTLSNNATDGANDIDIAAGTAVGSAGVYMMVLAATLTKQLDAAWAEGDGVGGLFSGTKANDTWYHLFLIRKDDGGTIDAGFDTSVTAANIPSGWSSYRRLGSVLTNGSSNILGFSQEGDEFLFDAVIADFSTNNPGTSAVLQALAVPLGLKVRAIVDLSFKNNMGNGTMGHMFVSSPDQTAAVPSSTIHSLVIFGRGGSSLSFSAGRFIIRTDASQQIRYQVDNSGTNTDINGTLIGWIDHRDR